MISADEVLARLMDGNRRFATGASRGGILSLSKTERRSNLAEGQEPFAVVLGCSDSRVPVEVILDREPGELFVVRVAGNIVTPVTVGTVEFALESFNTPLVVVLGHTRCGAVGATVDWLMEGAAPASPSLNAIVEAIRSSVVATPDRPGRLPSEPGGGRDGSNDRDRIVAGAVRANAHAMVRRLCESSAIVRRRVDNGTVRVVAAVYSLEVGKVELLDA
jgi:carbonic anhydrase